MKNNKIEVAIKQLNKKYKPKKKGITISICQNKGGVGKTTTTQNLGYLFSKIGKTLLIDLDPQANLSQVFNILIKDEPSLKEFIDTREFGAIYNIESNLDIIPNTKGFEDWKKSLITKRNSSYLLFEALKLIKEKYDFILIDCPPSMDISFDLALYSSDYVFIIMQGQPFAMQGLENILSEIRKVKDNDVSGELNLKVLGIIFNLYNNRTLINTIIEEAKENYPIFNNKIRENITIPESQLMKKSIFEYDNTCHGSEDFYNLFIEIMEKI